MKKIKKNPLSIIGNSLIIDLLVIIIIFILNFLDKEISIFFGELGFFSLLLIITISQLIVFSYIFLSWYFENFYLTKNSFIQERGVLFKSRKMYPLDQLKSVESKQSPIGKILDFGSLIISNDVNENGVKFWFIPKPDTVVEYIKKTKSAKKDNVGSLPKKNINLDYLLKEGENNNIEYKSSFRWDYNEKKVNKTLEKVVVKSITGFMNANGGNLIIGIDDKKNILGLEKDYKTLPKKNRDGFENHLGQVFSDLSGVENRQFLSIKFYKKDSKDICVINVNPSYNPVYMKVNGKDEFYVRTGNSTVPMTIREATSYIRSKWQ